MERNNSILGFNRGINNREDDSEYSDLYFFWVKYELEKNEYK